MIPSPPLDCAACQRTIGKGSGHDLTEDQRVLCMRCLFRRDLHGTFWPGCPVPWHDVFDHTSGVSGTRAGVAAVLGLWPTPKARQRRQGRVGEQHTRPAEAERPRVWIVRWVRNDGTETRHQTSCARHPAQRFLAALLDHERTAGMFSTAATWEQQP